MALFEPCSSELFFKSSKSQDPRLGELLSSPSVDAATRNFILAGYPDDEGIQINGGRVGARLAPDVIRKYFYKMTPKDLTPSFQFQDLGNLKKQGDLASLHDLLKKEIAKKSNADTTWLSLGGGHDYGYPDGAGFLLSLKDSKLKPLVINFDAHLDVRSTDQGLSSGTPFYRLLTDKSLPAFDFVEIGVQLHCNSPYHMTWLKERGATVLTLQELLIENNFVNTTFSRLAPLLLQKRPTFLSIDIDAFSSAYAPGCSQSWSTGLIPNDFMLLLNILKQRLDLRSVGIYEVSPPLDIDDRTAKLAAQILYTVIYG